MLQEFGLDIGRVYLGLLLLLLLLARLLRYLLGLHCLGCDRLRWLLLLLLLLLLLSRVHLRELLRQHAERSSAQEGNKCKMRA